MYSEEYSKEDTNLFIHAISSVDEKKALSILQEKKPDVGYIFEPDSSSPLTLACKNKMSVLALKLIETGKSKPEHVNNLGYTALIYACLFGFKLKIVALKLIETGKSKPEHVNNLGNTALIFACQNKLEDIALKLIETGNSKPEQVNNKGNTALMIACYNGCYNGMENVALKLIETGNSNPEHIYNGVDAYRNAKNHKLTKVIKMLEILKKQKPHKIFPLEPFKLITTKEQVYNLPMYYFAFTSLYRAEKRYNEQVQEMSFFIEQKYTKNRKISKNDVIEYLLSHKNMCSKKDKGITTTYLSSQMSQTQNNTLVIMDETSTVPHSILIFYYDTHRNMINVPALCVNQDERATKGGTVLMEILKSACRYAGIKNIFLESVEGAVTFYEKQDFGSYKKSNPASEGLKKMTLKKNLKPFGSAEKRTLFQSFQSSAKTLTQGSNSKPIIENNENKNSNHLLSNRGSEGKIIIEQDNIVKEFNETNEPKVMSIMKNASVSGEKTLIDLTLIDLEKNKEYVFIDDSLYVNEENYSGREKSRSKKTSKKSSSIASNSRKTNKTYSRRRTSKHTGGNKKTKKRK
jgi:ankyrin repeat protein/N-acetylglutamate synthase-like GNAT family acetyltransferase